MGLNSTGRAFKLKRSWWMNGFGHDVCSAARAESLKLSSAVVSDGRRDDEVE